VTRLPALGPRGEGWVAIQGILLAAVAVGGLTGPAWSGPLRIVTSLLGVALVAGGGFLFFAAWIVRLLEENRRHAARVERTLDRVDRVLAAVATDAAAAAASPASMTNGVDAGSTTTTAGRQAPAGGRSE